MGVIRRPGLKSAASFCLGAALLLLASPLVAPQLLAFPHYAEAGDSRIWSETEIDPVALERVIARSEALIEASPIARKSEPRHIFLTDGGWRWLWLANSSRESFALTRAATDPVILVNRSDLAADTVHADRPFANRRRLSAVIAHEATHGMLRRHFGILRSISQPAWLSEGYSDHVAQESTLSDAEAERMLASGESHPALFYYQSRRRVAEILESNGGDVDALFEEKD